MSLSILYSKHCCTYLENINENELKIKFEEGLRLCKAKLTEYFNKGTLFSYAGMILKPRIKTNIYLKEHWNAELIDFIAMYKNDFINRLKSHYYYYYGNDEIERKPISRFKKKLNTIYFVDSL